MAGSRTTDTEHAQARPAPVELSRAEPVEGQPQPRIREQARDTLAVAAFSLGASVTATAFVWVLLWCLS